jgi:hypothetical protein
MTDSFIKNLRIFRAGNRTIGVGAYFLAAIIGSNILLLSATAPHWAFAQGDNWYVGKGVKPNTYYTYKIQQLDTNEGRPFLMTIYFKEFDDANKYWIAPVFVVDQGQVFNGTFHLSDLDMSALGSSIVPPEMAKYRSGYANSLQWLASYVPKPGQSLSAPNWGKIAAIGGSPISPDGSAKVTTPAGTFDTVLVTWVYGATNRIWINPNMPYPIKAETFAGVTSGKPPTLFAFELQATGTGQPPIPKAVEEIPKSPLTLRTERGSYSIKLLWEPDPIVAGKQTKLGLIFSDSFGATISSVTYDLSITAENGTVVTDLKNQRADEGTGLLTVTFPSPGPYDVKVTITSVEGATMGEFIESSTFRVIAA